MQNYLTAVTEQSTALEGKVLAVLPMLGLTPSQALARAVAMVETPHLAILDVRAQPAAANWAQALRSRLADPAVVMAGARTLIPTGNDIRQAAVQGPIVIGADTRLGAGHMPDDPGPGGWLLVDQEASAIAPPGLLVRSDALKACSFPDFTGDALWIDLCAQLRAPGAKLVWTPDVSFLAPPDAIHPDAASSFRNGTPAAQILPWADPYHHPALSLHGDLLVSESRTGLIRAVPTDQHSLLVSGDPLAGSPVLNAARALRRAGITEADWIPGAARCGGISAAAPRLAGCASTRCAPRMNSARPTRLSTPPYRSRRPCPRWPRHPSSMPPRRGWSRNCVGSARQASPSLYGARRLARASGRSSPLAPGSTPSHACCGSTKASPPWLVDLINDTLESASWIVVERKGASYAGSVARIAPQESEFAWAQAMAELGPQIMVRPANAETYADHYPALLAAAAGCHILTDERLDIPPGLGAVPLPVPRRRLDRGLRAAIADLKTTLNMYAACRSTGFAGVGGRPAAVAELWAEFCAEFCAGSRPAAECRRMSLRRRALLAFCLAACPSLAWAGESADAVTAAVRQAQSLAPPGAAISLGPVAGAQYMQPCGTALTVSMSGNAPYEQAAVRCPAPSWTLYVTVTVAQSENVVVAARPVTAGHAFTADDLRLASLPVQQFAGRQVYFDPAQLIGAQADMSLATGMPITTDAVQAPVVVKAGQTVTVNVLSGGVQLHDVTEQTGRIGDTIQFTNPSTGRRFTAQVTAGGVELVLQ